MQSTNKFRYLPMCSQASNEHTSVMASKKMPKHSRDCAGGDRELPEDVNLKPWQIQIVDMCRRGECKNTINVLHHPDQTDEDLKIKEFVKYVCTHLDGYELPTGHPISIRRDVYDTMLRTHDHHPTVVCGSMDRNRSLGIWSLCNTMLSGVLKARKSRWSFTPPAIWLFTTRYDNQGKQKLKIQVWNIDEHGHLVKVCRT